jgi:Ca-activated chloride channel family protein
LRGAAAYRSEDYPAAAQDFATGDSADAHYNRGNALARAGQYEKALAAYDDALAREPDMADARANRKAVEDFLKQQQSAAQNRQDSKGKGETSPPTPKDQGTPSSASSSKSSGDSSSGEDQDRKDARSPSEPRQEARNGGRSGDRARTAQEGTSATGASAGDNAQRDAKEAEKQQAMDQWLRRVPDDPGGLLRRRFALEYQRRQAEGQSEDQQP